VYSTQLNPGVAVIAVDGELAYIQNVLKDVRRGIVSTRPRTIVDSGAAVSAGVLAAIMTFLIAALLVTGSVIAAIFVLILTVVLLVLGFEQGTIGRNQHAFFVKRDLLARYEPGPAFYFVARTTSVRKILLVAHMLTIPKEPKGPEVTVSRGRRGRRASDASVPRDEPPQLWALAADSVRVSVSVLAKYSLVPEGEANSAEFELNLWLMGDDEKIQERCRPVLEMAIRQVMGCYTALDASTKYREEVRQLIFDTAVPLLAKVNVQLNTLLLGAVMPEEEVRRHEIYMRDLEALERSMGEKGLAKHRIDALEKAGIVVVSADPSVSLAAKGPLPPPPAHPGS
jgi:regulator of protease activity HflC (stomatin/prohibitin superfamily)